MAVRYTHDPVEYDPHSTPPEDPAVLWQWIRAKTRARKIVVALLLARDGDRCRGCGTVMTREHGCPRQLTVDHVVPYSRGGDVLLPNLHLLCATCNAAKGHHLPGEPQWPAHLLVPRAARPQLLAAA